MSLAQRQAGLGAFEGLALTLFIAAEHQGPIGRIEVEATTSQNFSSKAISLKSLKLLSRCGAIE
jgi:hypothetical protein